MKYFNYSNSINLLKKSIWLLIIVLLFFFFSKRENKEYTRIENFENFKNENSSQIILDPVFISSDSKNRPFTIKAKKAKKNPASHNLYNLKYPKGSLVDMSGDFLKIQSKEGIFNKSKEQMHLFEDVIFENQKGYTFKTNSAFFDFSLKQVSGNEKIIGTGTKGNIKSEGFKIVDNGEKIFFLGKTTLTINSNEK